MMEMLEIMREITKEIEKKMPEDEMKELRELASLQAEMQRSLIHSEFIDTGKVKRINELLRKHLYHGEQEEAKAESKVREPVKTFDFGEAIQRMKDGARVARVGWNGKDQYIALATNIRFDTKCSTTAMAAHEDIGSQAVAFFGTRGVQIGWLASQADMLADDWYQRYKEV